MITRTSCAGDTLKGTENETGMTCLWEDTQEATEIRQIGAPSHIRHSDLLRYSLALELTLAETSKVNSAVLESRLVVDHKRLCHDVSHNCFSRISRKADSSFGLALFP